MTTSTITYKSRTGEFDSTHDTNDVVWQIITKEHTEENLGSVITDAQWSAFIARYADEIASEMSRMTAELFKDATITEGK